MTYTKRRVRQHIMEDQSVRIIRDALPEEWVVREYKPDYGIDLTVEIFQFLDGKREEAATLGETVFVQVKSKRQLAPTKRIVYGRRNVELAPLTLNRTDSTEISVVSLQLETSELLTVQAIGACVPVFLFLVDLSTEDIYYVCLNDYVEKVIIPEDPEYAKRGTKTIHIPVQNRISKHALGSARPIATYAKRPKLYAAFEKFGYQLHIMEAAVISYRAAASEDRRVEAERFLIDLVRHFLSIILRYDFWERIPEWQPIRWSYIELSALHRLFQQTGVSSDLVTLQHYLITQSAHRRAPGYVENMELDVAKDELHTEILITWQRLGNLGRIYEEVAREWFLPTYLSELLVEI